MRKISFVFFGYVLLQTLNQPAFADDASVNWKVEYESRKDNFPYVGGFETGFDAFKAELKSCKKVLGSKASTSCLAECSLWWIDTYGYNSDHDTPQYPEQRMKAQITKSCL